MTADRIHGVNAGHQSNSNSTARARYVLFAAVGAAVLSMLVPQAVSAHAALESSTPANGDVIDAAPSEISVRFTEPLEQSYSRLELYDNLGDRIEGASLTFGQDGYTMLLGPPSGLPDGTYSTHWP